MRHDEVRFNVGKSSIFETTIRAGPGFALCNNNLSPPLYFTRPNGASPLTGPSGPVHDAVPTTGEGTITLAAARGRLEMLR